MRIDAIQHTLALAALRCRERRRPGIISISSGSSRNVKQHTRILDDGSRIHLHKTI